MASDRELRCNMFYSKSNNGFYSKDVNGSNIPDDAVEVSDDYYQHLLNE